MQCLLTCHILWKLHFMNINDMSSSLILCYQLTLYHLMEPSDSVIMVENCGDKWLTFKLTGHFKQELIDLSYK